MNSTVKKVLIAAGLVAVSAAPLAAQAHGLSVNVGIGGGYYAPAYGPSYYAPAPVYYAPAPVYYGPAYYGPAYYGPSYYGPRFGVGVGYYGRPGYYGHGGWGHGGGHGGYRR
jgi:hypothetical protein